MNLSEAIALLILNAAGLVLVVYLMMINAGIMEKRNNRK